MKVAPALGAILTYSWKAAIHFLPFLLLSSSVEAGISRAPLITLHQYEDSGIKLICTSGEMGFPEIQLLWIDGKGQEIPATSAPIGNTSITSSILLKPGSGNIVSCRVINKSTRTSMGATTVVIGDVFFPSTSLLMVGFFVIAVLSIAVMILTIYKLKRDRLKIALTENDYKAIEEENVHLQSVLEKEKIESANALKETQNNLEKALAELDFRRASAYAVSVTLDHECTHAKLNIKDKNRVKLDQLNSRQKTLKGALIAVADEGYSSGKQYWEVEVGDKPAWQMGVLTEPKRNRLAQEKLEKPLEEGFVALELFQDQYHCIGGNSITESQNEKCAVVGVFLDMQEEILSFYNVQMMCLIRSIPIEFSEKMYPFFNPGNDQRYLGVRPVSIPP